MGIIFATVRKVFETEKSLRWKSVDAPSDREESCAATFSLVSRKKRGGRRRNARACIVSRDNVAENVEDTRRLFVRTAFVRWFNCHRKVVLNFIVISIGRIRGRYCHEMTEAPLLSEEARISPMIEEKRSTRDTSTDRVRGSTRGQKLLRNDTREYTPSKCTPCFFFFLSRIDATHRLKSRYTSKISRYIVNFDRRNSRI